MRSAISLAIVLVALAGVARADGEAQQADTKAALATLENWLGSNPNADQWRKFLDLPALHKQVDHFDQVEVIQHVLKRLNSDTPGLDLPKFNRLRETLTAWLDVVVPPSPEQVLEAVKKAAGEFKPPTAADLAAAKTRLDTDLRGLDQYLNSLGKTGVGWRNYLGFAQLNQELAAVTAPAKPAPAPAAGELPAPTSGTAPSDGPSLSDGPAAADTAPADSTAADAASAADAAADARLEALSKYLSRFEANVPGLEYPPFLAAGNALAQYIELAEVIAEAGPNPDQSKLAAQYAGTMADLAKSVQDYQSKPSEELAADIDRRLGWLWTRHLNRDLVQLIGRCYGRPNVFVAIQKSFIATGIERPVEERNAPLSDNILGTSISGRTTTVGQLKVELVPSPNKAVIDALLAATVSSNTVGQNGPATIYAQGTTQIAGRKRVIVDALGIHTLPATAAAVTRTQINSVGMSGLGRGIAEQRVAEGKGPAERVSAQHAESRLKARLDNEMAANIAKANKNYNEKLRNPLLRLRKFPPLLDLNTTPEEISVEVLEASPSQLAAASDPPNLAAWRKEFPLVAVVHQSAVNNGTTDFLAGVTLKDDEVRQKIIEFNGGKLPDRLVNDADQQPWSIRFAKNRPISLDIRPGGLAVTVRGQAYTTDEGGKNKHGAMYITAVYKIESSEAGPRLVREGDLEINPPNFNPDKSRLSVSQISLKTVLKKKFGKIFPQEVKPEPIVLSGRWKEQGYLIVDRLEANDGWLSVAYRWVPSPPGAAKPVVKQN